MFSEREQKIINILENKNIRKTVREVSDELFSGKKNIPFDKEISVSNSINRIIKKCEHYGIRWTISKEKFDGKLIYKKVQI